MKRAQLPYSHFVNYLRLMCCAAVLVLSGCSGAAPDLYAPPIDRKPWNGPGSSRVGAFVNMNDKNAEAYLVRDIDRNLDSGTWRWAYQRPELRFFLKTADGWKFKMDLAIAQSTFEQTGPVTLSFFVNNRLLDKVTYDRPGSKQFEKAVPPEMLIAGAMNTVSVETGKMWVSPVDGARLGFILTRAGFVR